MDQFRSLLCSEEKVRQSVVHLVHSTGLLRPEVEVIKQQQRKANKRSEKLNELRYFHVRLSI